MLILGQIPNQTYHILINLEVCHLFKQIEKIYNRIKRKQNMLNYHFLLSRMFPMIGRADLVPFLFVLHSKRKLREYDLMWKKMMTLIPLSLNQFH